MANRRVQRTVRSYRTITICFGFICHKSYRLNIKEWEVAMAKVSTTISSRGQLVIPNEIRKQLNLKPGAQFVVAGEKDIVIMKNIVPPSVDEFDARIGG